MMKILFVCHGNICRSPMAEFVMKNLLAKAGRDDVVVESAALHTDEIGSDIHRGTRQKLEAMKIPFVSRAAWLLTAAKAREYDLLIGMDSYNIADLKRLVYPEDRGKIHRLLEFANVNRDVADPWYTGDFDVTWDDILAGCTALLQRLKKDEIRRSMRERRKALTPEERTAASAIVCAKLAALNFRPPVAVYLASPQEIDLSPFIRKLLATGVKVVAPRWNGKTYELAVLKGVDKAHLHKGPMGILEPVEAEIVSPKAVGVWLVPGLAFTRNGKRLGYGGGWYDRLLAEASKDALKIGIAYSFQVTGELPSEPHDVPITVVVDDLRTVFDAGDNRQRGWHRLDESRSC